MHVELEPEEIKSLIEGLDCFKTKIAFTKGLSPAEKNEKIRKAETLERKLREIADTTG
jgi:hypothetical protein